MIAGVAVIAVAVAAWLLMPRDRVLSPELASPKAATLPALAPPQGAQPPITVAPVESPPAPEP